MRNKLSVFMVAFVLIATVAAASASEPTGDDMIPDVLLVRPVSFASIAVGFVVFVASLPVSVPSGSVGTVWKRLVADPFEFTFVRPVGDFDYQVGTGEWKKKSP
jgi:hypothetical protein